jgi:ATP-dependent helicase/nuclease subunit A
VSGRLVVGRFGAPPSDDMMRLADREARREAQRRFDRPLVLQAGAGTGKTTTLVARLLAWTLGAGWDLALQKRAALPAARPAVRPEGEGNPERIAAEVLRGVVAITFTEAAAAEMAERTAKELGSLARDAAMPGWLDPDVLPSAGETARRARALLGALDHLQVRTIHAFCLGLLADHPLEAGVHPRLAVDADGRLLDEVVRETVESNLREGYGAPGDPHLMALAVRGFGPQEIVEALVALAAAGLPARFLEADPLGPEPLGAFRDRLVTAASAVHELIAPRLGSRAPKNARAIERGLGLLLDRLRSAEEAHDQAQNEPDLATLKSWVDDLLPENLVAHLGKWEKRRHLGATETVLLEEVLADLEGSAGDLERLLVHLRRIDPALLEAARRALAPLLARVERELRARGIATFDALLTGAEALLARNPDVRARVRRRIDQLLVDEFQDTDQVQCEILRWIALDGPRDERPGLFLVGDPKQSIYGWRSADLRAYDGFVDLARKHGGEVRSLVENFRSVPAILAEVARVIAPVMREKPGLQPPFEPLLACERRRDDPGFVRAGRAPVEHWVSWKREGEGSGPKVRGRTPMVEAAELEAAALAADVRALHDQEAVAWGEVAVLLRGTGDLDTYLEAMRRARIPFVVGRDKQYYRRREVIEVSALVRAVLDPGDHLALLTVLRSVMVGVPDAALIPLWRRGLPGRITDLRLDGTGLAELRDVGELVTAAAAEVPQDVPGIERLRGWEQGLLAAIEHLAVLRHSFQSEPADLFVERLRRLFLPEVLESARYLGPYRLANLDRFFRQLLSAIEDGGGDLTAILRALRKSVAEAREAEEGRPKDGAEDAVQVMTIHGAKGLDFEHVYLVQLHKVPGGDNGDGTEVGRLEEGRFEVRLFGAPTLGFDRVEAERRAVEAAERVRTLYVAMTRPKDRLVLMGIWPDGGPDGGPAAGSDGGPDAGRRPPEQARTHMDLLAWRPDRPVEALAELWERAVADGVDGAGAFPDPAGALWKFPALGPQPRDEGADAGAADGAALPDPEEIARASAALRADRAAAAAHMERSWGGAASEEAHALLREELAERRLEEGEDRARRSSAPRKGGSGGALDREAAMAAGGAIHRALEEWNLEADPRDELARQRVRLPAYLAPLARGEALDQALVRAEELLDRFGGSRLLERLRELKDVIVARELPVLLPPRSTNGASGSAHAPVGVVTGAVDLVYRDPATGLVVIADFKTDEVDDPAEIERRAAVYAPQGATYVRALQEALDLAKPPRFELWFLRADRVVAPR